MSRWWGRSRPVPPIGSSPGSSRASPPGPAPGRAPAAPPDPAGVLAPLQEGAVLVLFHLPRTGGTSLRQALMLALPGQILFHAEVLDAAARAGRPYDEFVRDTPALFAGKRVLIGHFGREDPLVAFCPGRKVFAGVIRDPVERVLSLYDFARGDPRHPRYADLAQRSLLEALMDLPDLRANAVDAQLLQLFGTRDRFAILREIAAGSYLVGRHDQLPLFWRAVQALLGIRAELPRINRREDIPPRPGLVPLAEQPDHGTALAALRALSAPEIEFFARMPPLIVSPALRAG